MTDWRLYFALLHVWLLPVSRAAAVEVRLTPSEMSWYFEFLETYVFPFILAASIALLIGYGISRLFERSSESDASDADFPSSEPPVPPTLELEPEHRSEQEIESGSTRWPEPGSRPDLEPESEREPIVAVFEPDGADSVPLSTPALVRRISARAAEQKTAGDGGLGPVEAPTNKRNLDDTDTLVHRISARVTEQMMGGAAPEAASKASLSGRKLDMLLQRIGAGVAAEDSKRKDRDDDGTDALPEDESAAKADALDDLTPAARLDALLARIGERSAEAGARKDELGATAQPVNDAADQAPSDRLDSLIQRIGARASGQLVDEAEDSSVRSETERADETTPAERLEALMKRVGSESPPHRPDSEEIEKAVPEEAQPADDVSPMDASIPSYRTDHEGIDKSVSDLSDAMASESFDGHEPLSPIVSDDDLPNLEETFDTETDEPFDRRIEPTIIMPDGLSAADRDPSLEAAMDVPDDIELEEPIDVEPDGPVGIEPDRDFDAGTEPPRQPSLEAADDTDYEGPATRKETRSADGDGGPRMDEASYAPTFDETEEPAQFDAGPEGGEEDPGSREDSALDIPVHRDAAPTQKDRWARDAAAELMGGPLTDRMNRALDSGKEYDANARHEASERTGENDSADEEETFVGGAPSPAGTEIESISTSVAKPDSNAAALTAARIAADLDEAVKTLRRLSAIVDGYETAREGLDVEAVSGMHLPEFEIPDDAEIKLYPLGERVLGAAIAGYGKISHFNHVVDRLVEMAKHAPLDEGWNELLQDQISETIGLIEAVCDRLRHVGSDCSVTIERSPHREREHGDTENPTRLPLGGE